MFKAKDVIFTLAMVFSAGVLTGADSWQPRMPVPGPRAAHSAVWTGREMIVWGGGVDGQFLNTGACYNPATDTWRVTNPSNAPSPRWFQAAVWTGSEMIIWGGRANFFGVNNYNDGARYNPSTDSWTRMSTQAAPSPRSQCAAVWTGSEMIIWGGETEDGIELNDGARYNPETDAWTAISNGSGLEPRMEPTGIWTGEEFIVFGGMKFTGGQLSFGNGARYSPATDAWVPLPGGNSPGSRSGHTAVWTGERMIVWGGRMVPEHVALNTGASFDPGANLWSPLPVTSALPVRMYHAAVWTGTEMIVWGGMTVDGTMLNTGARYKPALQTWTPTTQDGAPRQRHFWRPDLGIWTGSGMLICGGSDYPASIDSTALYIPGGSAPPPDPGVLIQFEPPSLPHGSKLITSWNEQGFGFTTGSGRMAHTDSSVSTNRPQNGSAYLQFLFGDKPLFISNLMGRTFALKRVDLAEYSTVFPVPKTITFTGYYPDGSSVVQAFTTDGAIDGGGPVLDFETFTFPSSFAGLVRVEVMPDGYSLDNLLVSVGTNAPPPPPPPPPPPASGYDVARDFSATHNPNGAWSYGYQTTLGGPFTLLTFPLTSYADNPVPVDGWSKNGYEPVAVYHNGTTNTSISDGGAGTFPPGTTWFYPGVEGHADNYGVIRFTVPSGRAGTYQLKTEVRAYLDGPRSGDTDFHVLKNGIELFGEAVPGNSGTSYSNHLSLAEGDTIDFAVGRGLDGIAYDSGLKIKAVLIPVTNAPPPPPPPPPGSFDLSRDYSLAGNPTGPWTYGYLTALGSNGFFGPLGASRTFGADNGVPIGVWELTTYQLPVVAKVLGPGTAHSDGDHFTADPGTVYFAPGADGAPQNFGAIRFTVPAGGGGVYRLETSVRSLFDGGRSRDADFHVLKNGQQLFGQFLPPNSGTGYSNTLVLAAGDRLDFAIGRGADGLTADTGLKIRATLTLATNAPPPPPPPPPAAFDLSRDYSLAANPNGPWTYGYLTALGSNGFFGLLGASRTFSADNGVPIAAWELSTYQIPGVWKVMGPGVAHSDGDHFTAEPGTVYFAPGADGAPQNFGAIRFTVPAAAGGVYRLETSVRSLFDGSRSRDADFHVLRNGQQLFGQFLAPNSGTGYSNTLVLAAGDRVDFAIGRGADGTTYDTGLKIQATLTLATNAPPPPRAGYDVARDYSMTNNPAGPWSYGWKGTVGGSFAPITFSKHFSADNGVALFTWQLSASELPSVSYVVGPGTAVSAGGQFVAEPGTVYFTAGADGSPYNLGAVRFTVPAGQGGSYRLETSVRDLFDGFHQGDTDFHVVRNGQELFGQFVPVHTTAGYSNVLALAEGDTIDLLVGRGQDGYQAGSGLKLLARLTRTPVPPVPPLPPLPPGSFDLSRDYSLAGNPNGPWTYGYLTALSNGSFGVLADSRTFSADNGVPIAAWELTTYQIPGVWKVMGPGTAHSDGDHFTAEPGTVYFAPGADGAPQNFGVIRFTVPTGADGSYRLQTSVRSLFDGGRSRDADFHVLKNGQELFGQFLPPNSGTTYSNVLVLAPGDQLDFVIGRGADGLTADTGLKIQASLAPLPMPPRAFDLSNDFTLEANPNGPWSYGHASGAPNGDFALITTSRTFGAENGVPIAIWQLIPPGKPWVAKVLGPETAVSSFFEAPAGTVYFGPDPDATPEDFGVIRFTTPTNGVYRLDTAVRTLYDGPRSADADFYVLRNGVELFQAALEPNSGTAYTNLLILTAGDVIDFVAGRGANARPDTGLKIHATLFQLGTLPPRPPPEPPIYCVPSPAGLVAWWPAEGNANDVVGTNSGTLFGGASYVTGRVSRAFAFSGTNGGVKIPASPSLDVGSGGGLTIEGWINPATLSVRGPLVEWNRGGTNAIEWGAHLYILHPEEFGLGAGNLVANLTEANGQWHMLQAPGGTIQANTWQHIALTYDKASGEGRLYRNGEVVAAGNLGSFTPETRHDLYLGRRPSGEGVLSYQGLLDEISIYSRALSAAEIAGIAGAGASGKCRTPAELEQLVARVLELSSPIETPLLLAGLESVRVSLARGNLLSAIQQLQAFQTQVFLLVGPVDLALAEELAELARKVIDALDPTGVRRVMFVAASEAPLRLKRCVLTLAGAICVEGTGAPGANCWVQRSTNLVNWEPLGCATEIDDGEFEFIDANPPASATRFYRLYSP